MKLLKLRKFWLNTSMMIFLIACNNHTSNSNPHQDNTGKKNPVIITPSSKDTTKTNQKNTSSPNEEYDQHKIDSIKQNKPKPKNRKGGLDNDK